MFQVAFALQPLDLFGAHNLWSPDQWYQFRNHYGPQKGWPAPCLEDLPNSLHYEKDVQNKDVQIKEGRGEDVQKQRRPE